ncbi:MAG: DUF4185 domain-containing protein [Spirochaetes bacterium]|nr:DUF4185 domain-containing protein [Spirochaetota bacterium]
MKPPVISGILVFLLAVFTCCGGNAVNRGIFAPSRLDHIKGQDGVSSIPFDENTTLWTFADTIIPINEKDKSAPDGYTMISNSLAWTEKITPSNVSSVKFSYYTENGRVSQFIKNSRRENPLHHRLWALDGLRIGNRVYVYYAHIFVPDHTKFLEFTVKYIGLAVWDVPHNWSPGAGFDFRRTGILFPEGSPFFGAAAMIRDGYVYLAGHSKRGDAHPLSFARVKSEKIGDFKAYEFLDAAGCWNSDLQQCGYFFGDVAGECSLAYSEYYGAFDLFYARMFTGETVHVSFGSFSSIPGAQGRVIYRPAPHEKGKMWPYSGKEIFSSGKTTYLIYIDPEIYQPILVEYNR